MSEETVDTDETDETILGLTKDEMTGKVVGAIITTITVIAVKAAHKKITKVLAERRLKKIIEDQS